MSELLVGKEGPIDWSSKSLKEYCDKSGVYVIWNTVKNKGYVGSSVDFSARWRYGHYSSLCKNCHINLKLQNSWNKHGEKSFKIYVLEYCAVTHNVVVDEETEWITKLDSYKNGYNLTPTGDVRFEWTPELRQAARESLKAMNEKGIINSPKQREATGKRMREMRNSPEWQEKLKEMNTNGVVNSPEQRKAASVRMKKLCKKMWEDGILGTKEWREAKSNHMKSLYEKGLIPPVGEERRRELSDHMKKMWEDPEFVKIQMVRLHKMWEDPEYVEMMRDKGVKQWEDPEYRRIMDEATKKRCADPEYRKSKLDLMKRLHEDDALHTPEWHQHVNEVLTERNKTPKMRKASGERMKKLHEEGKIWTQETRQDQSNRMEKLWEDPEFVSKIMKARKDKKDKRLSYLLQYKDMILGWRNSGMIYGKIMNKLNEMGIDSGFGRKWSYSSTRNVVEYWNSNETSIHPLP